MIFKVAIPAPINLLGGAVKSNPPRNLEHDLEARKEAAHYSGSKTAVKENKGFDTDR